MNRARYEKRPLRHSEVAEMIYESARDVGVVADRRGWTELEESEQLVWRALMKGVTERMGLWAKAFGGSP